MKRCDNILKNKVFRECMEKTAGYEKERIYCLHNMEHAFDVARIAYIAALENGTGLEKEIIYAAALIHDIGRCMQYESGVAHEEASAAAGRGILRESGFSEEETELILSAVMEHRADIKHSELGELLHEADKKSRLCMLCSARDTCKWENDEMNMGVEY